MINLKLIVFALVLIIGCNGDNDPADCIGPNCESIDECDLSFQLDDCDKCCQEDGEGCFFFKDASGANCTPGSSIDCLINEQWCNCNDREYDCAGVCDGNNYEDDCTNCVSAPDPECCSSYFDHNISSQAAVYFFNSVTIGGVLVDPLDTVGAFKDDVCVGTRQWNTLGCGDEGVCDIFAHGDDNSTHTDGYCVTGDVPTFKIFDASEDKYYEAEAAGIVIKNPSGNSSQCEGEAPNCMEWSGLGNIIIDSLKAITASVINCD